jgi:hypothetical protein
MFPCHIRRADSDLVISSLGLFMRVGCPKLDLKLLIFRQIIKLTERAHWHAMMEGGLPEGPSINPRTCLSFRNGTVVVLVFVLCRTKCMGCSTTELLLQYSTPVLCTPRWTMPLPTHVYGTYVLHPRFSLTSDAHQRLLLAINHRF